MQSYKEQSFTRCFLLYLGKVKSRLNWQLTKKTSISNIENESKAIAQKSPIIFFFSTIAIWHISFFIAPSIFKEPINQSINVSREICKRTNSVFIWEFKDQRVDKYPFLPYACKNYIHWYTWTWSVLYMLIKI